VVFINKQKEAKRGGTSKTILVGLDDELLADRAPPDYPGFDRVEFVV
jgi:hypothetical protein